jgi:hypothetical protein
MSDCDMAREVSRSNFRTSAVGNNETHWFRKVNPRSGGRTEALVS